LAEEAKALETVYLAAAREVFMANVRRASRDYLVRLLRRHIAGGQGVLEAGCGLAYSSFALAREGYDVVGLDISTVLVQRLIELKALVEAETKRPLRMRFVCGNIFDLPVAGQQYELVFNHGVVEHFLNRKERMRALRALAASVSDGGRLLVAVPNLLNPIFRAALPRHGVPQMACLPTEALAAEMEAAGLRIVEQGYLFAAPGFEQWVRAPWLVWPTRLICNLWEVIPQPLRRVLSVHVYCVGGKGTQTNMCLSRHSDGSAPR
jgi:SAM-dependent methyltransferase